MGSIEVYAGDKRACQLCDSIAFNSSKSGRLRASIFRFKSETDG
jgi:hypothetical protein